MAVLNESVAAGIAAFLQSTYKLDGEGSVTKQELHAAFSTWWVDDQREIAAKDENWIPQLPPAPRAFFQHLPYVMAQVFPSAMHTRIKRQGKLGPFCYRGIVPHGLTPEGY